MRKSHNDLPTTRVFQSGMDIEESRMQRAQSLRSSRVSRRQTAINEILSDWSFQRHSGDHLTDNIPSPRLVAFMNQNGPQNSTGDHRDSVCLRLAIIEQKYDIALAFCQFNKARKSKSQGNHQDTAILLLSTNQAQVAHPKTISLLQALLQSGHSVNTVDNQQRTALFFAVNNPEFTRILIEEGADVNHRDALGRNPLFHAIYANNTESASLLIAAGCDVNAIDDFDHSPLILASAYGTVQMVRLSAQSGADLNCKVGEYAFVVTPLSMAIKHENYDIAKILVIHGADLELNLVDDQMIWDLLTVTPEEDESEGTGYYHEDGSGDVQMQEIGSWNLSNLNMEDTPIEQLFPALLSDQDGRTNQLSRGTVSRCKKRDLLKFMVKSQTERKMKGLKESELVCSLNIPTDLLHLIAVPLDWQ